MSNRAQTPAFVFGAMAYAGTHPAPRSRGAIRNFSFHQRFGLITIREEETAMMDWNRVEGNWKQMKGKIKEQWGKLTDDDLDMIAGKRDQLEGKIQERYGYEKDRTRKDIDDWYGRQNFH
jgi:uncharacterized protein YjbJ (UPF0337 family)